MADAGDAKVYVVHAQPWKDLSSAQRYGVLRWVFDDESFQPALAPGKAMGIVRDRLAEYRDAVDYICFPGGDPFGLMLVGMHLAGRPVLFLRWERERGIDGSRKRKGGFYVPTKFQYV